jgi:hypothetical protein
VSQQIFRKLTISRSEVEVHQLVQSDPLRLLVFGAGWLTSDLSWHKVNEKPRSGIEQAYQWLPNLYYVDPKLLTQLARHPMEPTLTVVELSARELPQSAVPLPSRTPAD